MSRAAARKLRNARSAVKAARTMLRNADVLGELTRFEPTGLERVHDHLRMCSAWFNAMAVRAEVRHRKGAR